MLDFNQLNWTPTIGDPTFIGWFTTVAYFISAILSISIYFSVNTLFAESTRYQQKIFWLLISFFLFFLCLNKQLDLQTLFTAVGRYYVAQFGWYQDRRAIQKIFVLSIILSSIVIFSFFMFYIRKILVKNRYAIFGCVCLCLFIILRAAAFNHVNFLSSNDSNFNWVLELSGIFLVIYGAFSAKKSSN